ncbi:MAG: peptidoglycan DD-metalloendopeptidase family protein [Cytophagales bacterium]|nr:peptidoglycan DD-metalloendopeptidase family protein [Cytophagales bacterium]MDW8384413.1 peptidoglycan DD-metalloendopeptidase family protein [Flammeovirgaceae bacterium]
MVGCYEIAAQSQNAELELIQKRRENEFRLRETEQVLQRTKLEQKNSLSRLKLLNHQIFYQNSIVEFLEKEIALIEENIKLHAHVVDLLKSDLEALKQEYAQIIYATAKTSHELEMLSYLFSSNSLKQLIARLHYLEQYKDSRKAQIAEIRKIVVTLEEKQNYLREKQKQKEELLQQAHQQATQLHKLKSEHQELVQKLKRKELDLLQLYDEQKEQLSQLENMISKTISAGMKSVTEKVSESTGIPILHTEAEIVSHRFSDHKGKLPWPVAQGVIVVRFGKQEHPLLKGLYVENPGIEIRTGDAEKVYAVFDGTVKAVKQVPGLGTMVILQHGDHFTVYAKLRNVLVRPGQTVNCKQEIGIVDSNEEGASELLFQIWKQNHKLDPEQWLAFKQP